MNGEHNTVIAESHVIDVALGNTMRFGRTVTQSPVDRREAPAQAQAEPGN